jgi:SnoaL-like protein
METAIDPKEFVSGFDALWNSGNREGILAAVNDASVVELEPTPPPPVQARYVGREQITQFLAMFLPGFHVESRNVRQEGEQIVWEWTARSDAFRVLGADPACGTGRVSLGPDGQLRKFHVRFDEATLESMASKQHA